VSVQNESLSGFLALKKAESAAGTKSGLNQSVKRTTSICRSSVTIGLLLSGGHSSCGLGEKAEGTCKHSSLQTAQQLAFRAEPRCELRSSQAPAERNPTEEAVMQIRDAAAI
jgi:hypothetical protein